VSHPRILKFLSLKRTVLSLLTLLLPVLFLVVSCQDRPHSAIPDFKLVQATTSSSIKGRAELVPRPQGFSSTAARWEPNRLLYKTSVRQGQGED